MRLGDPLGEEQLQPQPSIRLHRLVSPEAGRLPEASGYGSLEMAGGVYVARGSTRAA